MAQLFYRIFINGSRIQHESLEFNLEPKDPKKVPVARFVVPNRLSPGASQQSSLSAGDDVTIKDDNGVIVFNGLIDSRKFKIQNDQSVVEVVAVNTNYKKLSNYLCDSYDFLESNLDYGVTVNPWEYRILRSTDPSHDLEDLTQLGAPVFGFNQADVARALIGEKLLFSHDFLSTEYLLPTTTTGDSKYANVLRNPSVDSGAQTTPRLQLVPNEGSFRTSGSVESVPFFNGDPHIDEMGNITSATIRIYGVVPSGCGFTVDVCRNGGTSFGDDNLDFIGGDYASRDYENAVITATNANGTDQALEYTDVLGTEHSSGLNEVTYTYWEGTATFSGKAAGNSLAYRINLTGDGNNTPYLEYVVIDAVTVSDTGITEGTIDSYTGDTDITTSSFFEGDFVSKNRLEALSELRLSTLKDDVLEHFWNTWITIDGELYFQEDRGSLISGAYSLHNLKLSEIDYEFDDSDIWHTCVAYGAGSGKYRTRIVSEAEFADGGLKSSSVLSTYGDASKVGKYVDGNATTASQLLRKARIAFKLHQAPFESIRVNKGITIFDSIPFGIGDSILITVPELGIVAKEYPVEDLTIREDGSEGVSIEPVFGEPLASIENALSSLASNNQEVHVVRQAGSAQIGLTGAGTIFDNNNNGIFSFGISEPEKIDKVLLKAITVPYDSPARAGDAGGVSGGGGAGSGAVDASFNDKTGTLSDRNLDNTTDLDDTDLKESSADDDKSKFNTSTGSASTGGTYNQTVTPSTSSWTTLVGSTPFSPGTVTVQGDDIKLIFVTNFNDSASVRTWQARVTGITSGTVYDTQTAAVNRSTDIDSKTVSMGMCILSVGASDLDPSDSAVKVELQATDAGGWSDQFDFQEITLKNHNHENRGRLNDGDVSGRIGSSSLSLDAGDIFDLFSNIKLAYTLASGGTGSSFTGQDGNTYYTEHEHPFTINDIPLVFGIWAFAGDSDTDGNLEDAVFATKVKLHVDPASTTSPSASETLPVIFGDATQSVEIDEQDITSYLKRDSNGLITRGLHSIVISSSENSSPNENGLGKIQLVPLIIYKEG